MSEIFGRFEWNPALHSSCFRMDRLEFFPSRPFTDLRGMECSWLA
jgi:hypothetical protein